MRTLVLASFVALLQVPQAYAKTVRYELTVENKKVNMSGKAEVDFALTVNGGIPAPTLEFTEGDDAVIKVTNKIPNQEASIHWHGILLPPEMDGVPYLNTPPILPGHSHTFHFKIRQHGTYWYHSHTGVQEQKGVFGAFIIHPKRKTIAYDKDVVVVLSDWSDENADSILNNLKKDGDYYLHKKGTMRSWLGALQDGGLGNYLSNQWQKMEGMDLSDVGYDAFLMNGKRDSQLAIVHPGDRVRLRIINAGASSYFYVSLGKQPMKVISADGMDIEPVYAKEILMGMAETYDVLFTVPSHKNFELRATCQDGTGYASGWIGMGSKVFAPDRAAPGLYEAMDHSSMDHASHEMSEDDSEESDDSDHNMHAGHNMSVNQERPGTVVRTLTVDNYRARLSTALPKKKVHDVKLVLGGNMERYVWHINGKAIFENMFINVNEGDVIRFHFQNDTMMHHPMHLHGHFFRVLNGKGDRSPLKHTVDVPPHGSRTIEFYANEPGQWMFHCHNLFHMKTGMARVVQYVSFKPKPEILEHQKHDPHKHDHWYFYGMADAGTNHNELLLRYSQTWNQIEGRVEGRNTSGKSFSINEKWDTEGDLFYRRWVGNYLNLIAGGVAYSGRGAGAVGFGYTLPMLVETDLLVDHRGVVRLDLEKKFQWTKTIFSDAEFTWRPNLDHDLGHRSEYKVSLMYSPAWSWAVGLKATDESIGAGVKVQF